MIATPGVRLVKLERIVELILEMLPYLLAIFGGGLISILNKMRESRTARRRPATPARPARTVARPAPGIVGVEPRRHPALQAILGDVEEYLEEKAGEEVVRDLRPDLDRGLVEPLRGASGGGAVRADLVEEAREYWGLLRRAMDQRTGASAASPRGLFLEEIDALGREVLSEVRRDLALGGRFPIRRLLPVIVDPGEPLAAYDLRPAALTGIAIVPVPSDARREVWRWVLFHHNVAHLLWSHLPGLREGMAHATRTSSRSISSLAFGMISREGLAHLLVAGWMPEIFADTFTAVALGPAAAEGALHLFRGWSEPDLSRTRVRATRGPRVQIGQDPHPPPHLRIALICRVLARGPYEDEARRVWERWIREHGEPEEVLLDLFDGRDRPIAIDPFLDEVDRVTDRILTSRIRALERVPIEGRPGLAFPRDLHTRLEAAAEKGRPEVAAHDGSARAVIAFAAHLPAHHPLESDAIAGRLLAHLYRGDPLEAAAEVRGRAVAGTGAVADGHRLLREAIVWREVLLPPVALRRRGPRVSR